MSRPVALFILAALATAGVAHAGWGPDPVEVRASTTGIPIVVACNDGGAGTFVAWQEYSAYPNGLLRVQHVLSTGHLDPAWPPDGALASATPANRAIVEVVPDRLGGVYVCWMESSTLFVTRLGPTGQVAASWPPSGRSLGTGSGVWGRPRIIEDGSNGVIVAWRRSWEVVAQRLGPDGLSAGGWPEEPVVIAPSEAVTTYRLWQDVALGPDGSVFAAWATWSSDTTVVASGMYLRRLTGSGDNWPGWPTEGMPLGSFHLEILFPPGASNGPLSPLLGISPDGRGGLFCTVGTLWTLDGLPTVDYRLRRLTADGQPAPGWPVEGRAVPSWYSGGAGEDGWFRAYPDGLDGAIVEYGEVVLHSPPVTWVYRCTDAGQWSYPLVGLTAGHQVVPKGDGGAFMADFHPRGPFGINTPNAFLAVDQLYPPAGWTEWREVHTEISQDWFNDIALAPSGDGGVVLFWSQVHDRFGLYARKFSDNGLVTAVGPGSDAHSSALDRVRFVDGAGIIARVAPGTLPARLGLFDVGGRLVSSATLHDAGSGAADVTLPATASLSSGLYFVRLAWGGSAAVAKVAVVR